MEVMQIKSQSQYMMPGICCVCGAPAGENKMKVSGSSWSGKTTVTLGFPLCDACSEIEQEWTKRGRKGCLPTIAVSVILCGGAMAITQFFEVEKGTNLNGFVGCMFISAGLVLILGLIYQLVISRKDKYKQLGNAVRIKNYERGWSKGDKFTIEFQNKAFADLFKQMNAALILDSKKK